MNRRGFTVWFTGLSGAGKTTLSDLVGADLRARGFAVESLDGDVVSQYLTKGLGFSKEDRDENIRRIGWVAAMGTRLGGVMLVSAISPYREIRREVRDLVKNFVEVFVSCSLDELVRRDPKGLYKKALAGEIANFTGISDPYEDPVDPEVVVHTDCETPEASADRILGKLVELGYVLASDVDGCSDGHAPATVACQKVSET